MHDIKFIRENPAKFDEAMGKRGIEPQSASILKLDEERRKFLTEIQELQKKRNDLAKSVGMAKAKGENVESILSESKAVNEKIALLEKKTGDSGELNEILASLPNIPADDVPVGPEETANKIIRKFGEPKKLSFKAKQHFEIGEKLGQMDFEQAAKISGSRFVFLKNQLARLERAIANFMLDVHTNEFGYTEVSPPFMVKDNALYGTGQLPKFAEDSFKTTTGHWLIPTSEVPLTNYVADKILAEETLPLRMTAYTPCFRSEAGSAGKDTRGVIRMHQFSKVELVSITKAEDSKAEHERMLGCAEEILKRLELPYQVLLLSSHAGFSNQKTYDLEVWLPGQNAYREISSCSNCGDFQARRMKARYKSGGENKFVHTLNGTGLAVNRCMVAILENYQNEDGSVNIPAALQKYMNGEKIIK